VAIEPGLTAFTRIPRGASSTAAIFITAFSVALLEE
jgi:hypothetical protein